MIRLDDFKGIEESGFVATSSVIGVLALARLLSLELFEMFTTILDQWETGKAKVRAIRLKGKSKP